MQIVLKSTDILEVVTDIACDLDYVVSYLDIDSSFNPSGADLAHGNITTANTTTILGSPTAPATRTPKLITIRNKHVSAAPVVTVQFDRSGTNRQMHSVLLAAGECLQFVENQGFLVLAAPASGYGDELLRILDSAGTGTNGTAAQNWFPTNGAATVEAGTVYDFEGVLSLTRTAGTTSHTTSLLFGGTATLTSILWRANVKTGDTTANAADNATTARVATATVIKAASTSATEEVIVFVKGSVKINAAGTFIPQFSYSAAPGGAPTINLGSFFKLIKRGAGFNTKGIWV